MQGSRAPLHHASSVRLLSSWLLFTPFVLATDNSSFHPHGSAFGSLGAYWIWLSVGSERDEQLIASVVVVGVAVVVDVDRVSRIT